MHTAILSDPHHNHSIKSSHGLHWGLNRFVQPGWRIGLTERGGDCERLTDQRLDLIQPTDRILMMGNAYVNRDPDMRQFHHPDQVLGLCQQFYFWDNPPLPHILYRGAHNPLGHKNWMRITRQGIMPRANQHDPEQVRRINQQLQTLTGRRIQHWQQLTQGVRQLQPRSQRALVVESSSQVYARYAGTTRDQWLAEVCAECARQGLAVDIRPKQSRAERTHQELDQVLRERSYAATISFQSMAQVESLVAGTPAVNYLGEQLHSELITPWQEFRAGQLRQAPADSVEQEIESMFDQLWHKVEAYSGAWHE